MPNSNGDATNCVGLSSDVSVELGDLVLVNFRQLWLDKPFGINEVLLQKRLLNYVNMLLVHSIVRQHHLTQFLLNHSEMSHLFVLVESVVVLNCP